MVACLPELPGQPFALLKQGGCSSVGQSPGDSACFRLFSFDEYDTSREAYEHIIAGQNSSLQQAGNRLDLVAHEVGHNLTFQGKQVLLTPSYFGVSQFSVDTPDERSADAFASWALGEYNEAQIISDGETVATIRQAVADEILG